MFIETEVRRLFLIGMVEIMGKFEDETFYGISVNGREPCTWDKEIPDLEKTNLKFELLYKSCEIIKKNVTYESVKKLL